MLLNYQHLIKFNNTYLYCIC